MVHRELDPKPRGDLTLNVYTDKLGATLLRIVGVAVIACGMGTFAYGVHEQAAYDPILLIGLAVMGMGMSCTRMHLSGRAIQSLGPTQVARGSTLINVNQQVAGSVGTALMSVILTKQFNDSPRVLRGVRGGDRVRLPDVHPSGIPAEETGAVGPRPAGRASRA